MSHQSYLAGPRLELEADYVVVGSGAEARPRPWRSPVGARKSPSSRRVLGAIELSMQRLWRHARHDGRLGSLVTMGRAVWPVVQASLVGGTTVVNSAIAVRTPGDIFAPGAKSRRWRRRHGQAVWQAQDRIERELFVSRASDAALGGSNRLALVADGRLGLDGYRMDRYIKDCEGTGQCLQGCRSERKQSTNLNYIPEVMQRGGIVVSCAPVEKVVVENGSAKSVVGRFVHPVTKEKGRRYEVRAEKGSSSPLRSPRRRFS